MAMSRKHYNAIAALLADVNVNHSGSTVRKFIASGLVDILGEDNPRFDAERFLIASGFERVQ